MQDDRIHWNGQPIAVVLAETQEQADHAKSLIRATYEDEPATTALREAKAHGTEPGMFMGEPLQRDRRRRGGAGRRAVTVDRVYSTPRHNHNPIEPHAATLAWIGDELIVHDASQMVGATAWTIADVFGLESRRST